MKTNIVKFFRKERFQDKAMRGGWFAVNRHRGRPNGDFFPANWLWPLLAVALAFTVLRNLPVGAFVSP